jgi:hypothetical protein
MWLVYMSRGDDFHMRTCPLGFQRTLLIIIFQATHSTFYITLCISKVINEGSAMSTGVESNELCSCMHASIFETVQYSTWLAHEKELTSINYDFMGTIIAVHLTSRHVSTAGVMSKRVWISPSAWWLHVYMASCLHVYSSPHLHHHRHIVFMVFLVPYYVCAYVHHGVALTIPTVFIRPIILIISGYVLGTNWPFVHTCRRTYIHAYIPYIHTSPTYIPYTYKLQADSGGSWPSPRYAHIGTHSPIYTNC